MSPDKPAVGLAPLSNRRQNVPQGQDPVGCEGEMTPKTLEPVELAPVDVPVTWCAGDLAVGRYSVDMVRMELRFDLRFHESFEKQFMTSYVVSLFDEARSYVKPVSPGSYNTVATFRSGAMVIAMGVGLVSGSCKINPAKGFIEFNPNKIDEALLMEFLQYLGRFTWSAKLLRWDLAIDWRQPREAFRLFRYHNQQKYQYIVSKGAITEYAGSRNNPGFVKLYDKAKEQGLNGDLTRLELTLGSDPKDFEKYPLLIDFRYPIAATAGKRGTATYLVLAQLLQAQVLQGMNIDIFLRQLSRKVREQVQEVFAAGRVLEIDSQRVLTAFMAALHWQDLAGNTRGKTHSVA